MTAPTGVWSTTSIYIDRKTAVASSDPSTSVVGAAVLRHVKGEQGLRMSHDGLESHPSCASCPYMTKSHLQQANIMTAS